MGIGGRCESEAERERACPDKIRWEIHGELKLAEGDFYGAETDPERTRSSWD